MSEHYAVLLDEASFTMGDPENKCVTLCFPIKSTGGAMSLICL